MELSTQLKLIFLNSHSEQQSNYLQSFSLRLVSHKYFLKQLAFHPITFIAFEFSFLVIKSN